MQPGNVKVLDILSAAVLIPPKALSTPFWRTQNGKTTKYDGRSKSGDKISRAVIAGNNFLHKARPSPF